MENMPSLVWCLGLLSLRVYAKDIDLAESDVKKIDLVELYKSNH